MHATSVTSDTFLKVYHLTISRDDISQLVASFIEDKRRNYQQPGIRPGEASCELIRQLYQKEAESNGYQRFLEEWANQTTQDDSLKTARVIYKKLSTSKEKRLYEVSFDLFDTLPDIDFNIFHPEVAHVTIDDARITAEMEELGTKTLKTLPLTEVRLSRMGDALKIHRQLTRGNKKVFEETITYILRPEDAHSERFVNRRAGDIITEKETTRPGAGRPGVWQTHVQEVAEAAPCGVSPELSETLGFENLDALRNHIMQGLNKQGEIYVFTYLKHQLFEFILHQANFHVPDFLVDQEMNIMLSQLIDSHAPQDNEAFKDHFKKHHGMSLDEWKDKHREMAAQRVKLGLVLKAIKDKEAISLTTEEEHSAFLETLRQLPSRAKQKEMHTRYFSDKTSRNMIHAPFLEYKIVKFILSKVPQDKIIPITLDDLIRKVDDLET